MVDDSTNTTKTNNHCSREIIEHKKPGHLHGIQVLAFDRHKYVTGQSRKYEPRFGYRH